MSDRTEKDGLGLMDKAAEAIGGAVGSAKAAIGGGSTSSFITNARRGDLYELAAGAVALQRAGSPEVRMIAQMILDDHSTSSHQLMSALRMHESGGAEEPPADLDSHRQTMLDHLNKASDEEFDRLFLDQQAMAHRETLTLFEGYAERGENPQLASFARGAIPALRDHSAMVATAPHA